MNFQEIFKNPETSAKLAEAYEQLLAEKAATAANLEHLRETQREHALDGEAYDRIGEEIAKLEKRCNRLEDAAPQMRKKLQELLRAEEKAAGEGGLDKADKARAFTAAQIRKRLPAVLAETKALMALAEETDRNSDRANDFARSIGSTRHVRKVMVEFYKPGLDAPPLEKSVRLPRLDPELLPAWLEVDDAAREAARALLKSKGTWFDKADLPGTPEAVAIRQDIKNEVEQKARDERKAKARADREARDEAEREKKEQHLAEWDAKQADRYDEDETFTARMTRRRA